MKGRLAFLVSKKAAGSRLDRFLVEMFATAAAHDLAPSVAPPSRAELQRWVASGAVTVQGKPRGAADKVREGEEVLVHPMPPPASEAVAEEGIEFGVLYKDSELIVIDKPAGLVVHPGKGHHSGTLVNGLLALGIFAADLLDAPDAADEVDSSNAARTPTDPIAQSRPGIVHRLDKGTSGVMVICRTATARERLKVQFAEHSIEREYVALCDGSVKAETFDTLHGRHPSHRLRFTTRVAKGKRAITHVTPLERLAGGLATYVSCRLQTGRTHQIRVHLAESGTPILGDPLYGRAAEHDSVDAVARALGHQALHARVLGFVHPTTNQTMRFESPPPTDFLDALTQLRAISAKRSPSPARGKGRAV